MPRNGFLMIRILLQFRNAEDEDIGVTSLARTLGVEKYTISRTLQAMERKGLIDRDDQRHPQLTETGMAEAKKYADRIKVIQDHLLYEGLDQINASRDSFYWAVYSSDETLEMLHNLSERYRIRYEFRGKKRFTGAELCKKLPDGTYVFPFIIYRETVKDGTNISMANEGFEHPCTLHVKDGCGMLYLRAVEMSAVSRQTHNLMTGCVSSLKYFNDGEYLPAEKRGAILMFPADKIRFQNVGSDAGQILHGSISLKMTCTVGTSHMPESTAVFTILI